MGASAGEQRPDPAPLQAVAGEVDRAARDALENIWGELKAVFGLPGMTGVTRPRVVFHAAQAYDPRAMEILAMVARATAPLAAAPAGLGVYRGRRAVLALALHREGALGELHARLWRELAPVAHGVRPAYAAATWAPHVTLAEGALAGAPLDRIGAFLAGRPWTAPVPLANLALLGGAGGTVPLRSVSPGRVTFP